jgi:hypothetical protein
MARGESLVIGDFVRIAERLAEQAGGPAEPAAETSEAPETREGDR